MEMPQSQSLNQKKEKGKEKEIGITRKKKIATREADIKNAVKPPLILN